MAAGRDPSLRPASAPVVEQSPARANLRRLARLRLLGLVALIGIVWLVQGRFGLTLALPGLLWTACAVVVLSVLSLWRCTQIWPVRDWELCAQLALDVVALSAVFQASAGAANPFVSLYLVPVVLGAAILPRMQVWLLAGLSCLCYTLLLLEYAPILSHHHHPGAPAEFDLHVVGMWGNFVLSTAIIGIAVVNMGAALRAREAHLAKARENMLRTEQILGLATLAAGAAHELGTPLSTMAILSRELELDCADRPALQQDLRLLRSQVTLCKDIIQRMLTRNPVAGEEHAEKLELTEYLANVVQTWTLMRPRTPITYHADMPRSGLAVRDDASLAQSLINVLNNAADASPEGIEVLSQIEGSLLRLQVLDRGNGIDSEAAHQLGRAWFTRKAADGGLGLGLFLTNATLERLGGSVRLVNRDGGGACTTIELPLEQLQGSPQ